MFFTVLILPLDLGALTETNVLTFNHRELWISFQTMDYNETNTTLDQVASEGNFADIVFSEFFLEGVATPILGIFGFFGNVLSIKVTNVIVIPQNIDK